MRGVEGAMNQMSHDLALYTTAGAIARETRQTGRALSRIQGDCVIRQAAVDAELDVAVAKEQVVTAGCVAGVGAMLRMGQAESAAVLSMPNLSGRITPLAELHAQLTHAICDHLAHRVRRL